jgi:hypothetical protein
MTHIDIRELCEQLVAARPVLDAGQQRLTVALYAIRAGRARRSG